MSLSLRIPHQIPVYTFPLPVGAMYPIISFFSICSPEQYSVSMLIIKLFIVLFSPFPSYLLPLRPKYSPQHHILKHPQITFVTEYQWPSFKPIQNFSLLLISSGIEFWFVREFPKYMKCFTFLKERLSILYIMTFYCILNSRHDHVTTFINSEINPTRCNNFVYSSQWLYSTCFGWQFHPSSGVHMLYMA